MTTRALDGSDGMDDYSRLKAFLKKADLADHFSEIYFRLRVHRVEDLKDISDQDAESIGMTNPQYSRLKRFLRDKNSWTKIFRRNSGRERRPTSVVQDGTGSPRLGARYLISKDCLKFGKLLGTGEYGQVFQGEWSDETMSRVSVAIKTLSREAQPRSELDIRKEADAMHSLSHSNIIRLYGVVLNTSGPMMLVLELAPLGSLESLLLRDKSQFPMLKLYNYAEQVASGMEYLAEKQIVHRDLSTRNVLLITKNRVKISDFGLARPLARGKSYYQMSHPKSSMVAFGWTAPEALKTTRFTVQSDVWSFGVTLWEMFSHGALPWGELNAVQILELIDVPFMRRLDHPEHCPQDVYSLMLKCWTHNPEERPTFNALRQLIANIIPPTAIVVESLVVENDPDKLALKKGDIITVTEFANPSWWYGQNKSSGAYGTFPRSHVQLQEKRIDFGSSPPIRDHSPVSADDISNPHNPVHNFHIGHDQLDGMSELQLQQMLASKTIRPMMSGTAPGMGGPRRASSDSKASSDSVTSFESRSSSDSKLSSANLIVSATSSAAPPAIPPRTSQSAIQQRRPLPTLPRQRYTFQPGGDLLPEQQLPQMRYGQRQTVDSHRQTIADIPSQPLPRQPARQEQHRDPPPPYTQSRQGMTGWDGQFLHPLQDFSRARSHTASDLLSAGPPQYAHLWEARSSRPPKTSVDDSVLFTRTSLISFDEPVVPRDMPNPPNPYENQPVSLQRGEYATLNPAAENRPRKFRPPPLQAVVKEDDEEYMQMQSPLSKSPSPVGTDGRNSLSRSMSDPQMSPQAVEYIDMNEQKRLKMGLRPTGCGNPFKEYQIAPTSSPKPQSPGKPNISPRTHKTSSPKPVPRPRQVASQLRHPSSDAIDALSQEVGSATITDRVVPPPLPNNPPPVFSPERKPVPGPAIKVQRVQKALPDTTEQEAEEILKMYGWDVDATVRYLTVVRGAELTNYNKEHVQEVTAAYRDSAEAIRHLKVEKVLQFAHSAGLKKATLKSSQAALDHCQWNCNRALDFLLGQT